MADVKISALPAATTPLAGTEVLPIVQSGTTDQVSVANLTAGRTVNGAAFTATGTVSGATVTASGTVSGATVSGTTVSGTTVSGTTVNVGAGTVSAPSISPTGDSNTGIFFPAADTIAFAEGGVEALRIASSGQIGIGGANYGTAGQVLTSNGAAAAPSWQTVGNTAPTFSAYNNVAQTGLTINAYNKVNYNVEDFDTANSFDTTNARFTPNVAGYYQVNFTVQGGGSTNTGFVVSQLYKNGVAMPNVFSSGLNGGGTIYGNAVVVGATIVYMNGTTDYLEVYCFLGGSGTGTIAAGTGNFSAFLARSA
jgi:hypothetical protein